MKVADEHLRVGTKRRRLIIVTLGLGLAACGVQELPAATGPSSAADAAGTGGGNGAGTTDGGGTGGRPGVPDAVDAGPATGGRNGSGGRAGAGNTGGRAGAGNTGGSGPDAATPDPTPEPTPTLPLPPGGPSAARDKIVVFLHIGHSNMAGRATVPADLKPYFYDTDPRLWSYHGANPTLGNMPFAWSPAKEPLSPDAMTGTAAGPGMAMLRAALALAKPDVQFVSVGHGHSGEAGGVCRNYKKGGLLYEIMMAPARRLKGAVTFGGLFTMLGTTERHLDVAAQNGFADCMAQIAADVRGELDAPDMPFIMSDFEMEATGDTSPDLPYAKIIIAQLRVATTKITRSALIPTEQLGMEGSHHFDMAGHKEWGIRGMQILKDKGWAPWAR
jgi:hypothetical protein